MRDQTIQKKLTRTLAATVFSVTALSTTAFADETQTQKRFDGFYGGAEVSIQNIYSGAFIDDVDVLQNDHRTVASAILGWRNQFDNGLVLGIEGQFGFNNGDLERREPERGLVVNYSNSTHRGAGINFGYAFGQQKDLLVYGYAIATWRNFDIAINYGPFQFGQEDGMGIIRYGLGLEKQWSNGWGIRAAAGSNYTDFGDLTTNMNVNGKFEASAAIIYQF